MSCSRRDRKKLLFGPIEAPGDCISRACQAQGMQDRGGTPDARPCAHPDIDSAKIFSGGGDWVLEREKLDLGCAECGTQAARFSGHKFWARGCFVSTVGRDEEMIRAYIKNQEMADKQLDQLQLKGSQPHRILSLVLKVQNPEILQNRLWRFPSNPQFCWGLLAGYPLKVGVAGSNPATPTNIWQSCV